MNRKLMLLLLTGLIVTAMAACGGGAAPAEEEAAPAEEEAAAAEEEAAPAEEEAPAEEGIEELDIVLLIAATESDYWGEYIKTGAENAALDAEEKYGIKINFEVQGPAAEADQEEFLSILETVIASQPDGIAMGQVYPELVAQPVKEATEMGIRVNLVSLPAEGVSGEDFGTLYYCDQPEQGVLAAQAFYDALVKKDLPMDGKVGVHMSILIPILEEKKQTFIDTLSELAPDLEILPAEYNENDVNNCITLASAQLATYGDELVGFFGECNISGDGVARVIAESGRADTLVGVAVDSDPAEIEALGNGYLDALVVQTPYAQGYGAVMGIAEYYMEGIDGPDEVNMPAVVVTGENMDEPEMAALLDPTLLARD